VLKLIRLALKHMDGSSSCMWPYVDHHAAADLDRSAAMSLMQAVMFEGHGTAEHYQALLQLPSVQRTDAAAYERLILRYMLKYKAGTKGLLRVFLLQPAAQGTLWALCECLPWPWPEIRRGVRL
jgi:hypothetical protein